MFPGYENELPWPSEFEEQFNQQIQPLSPNQLSIPPPNSAMPTYNAPNNAFRTPHGHLATLPASQQMPHYQQQVHAAQLQPHAAQLQPLAHIHGHPVQVMPPPQPQATQRVEQTRGTAQRAPVNSFEPMVAQAGLSNRISQDKYGLTAFQPSVSSSIGKYEGREPYPTASAPRGIKRTLAGTEEPSSYSNTNVAPQAGYIVNDEGEDPETDDDQQQGEQTTTLAKSKITRANIKSNVGILALETHDFNLHFNSLDAARAMAYPRVPFTLDGDDADHIEAHPEEYVRNIIRAINYNGYLEPQELDKTEGLSESFVKAWEKWQSTNNDKVQKILRGEDKNYKTLQKNDIQNEIEALARVMVEAFVNASKLGCRKTIFGEDLTSKCSQRLNSAIIMLASYSIMRLDFLKEMKFDHFASNPEKFTLTKTSSMKSNWKRWVARKRSNAQGQDAEGQGPEDQNAEDEEAQDQDQQGLDIQDQDNAAVEAGRETDTEVEAEDANNASIVDDDGGALKKRGRRSNMPKPQQSRAKTSKKKKTSPADEE